MLFAVPHIHIGFAEAWKIFLLWAAIIIPLKIVAIWMHGNRLGQALGFLVL